jgi:peroxiredoxin
MALRLHLPQTILSDNELKFVSALKLPTFNVDSMTLVKRITLIIKDGVIEQVFYPIFPSTADVDLVISYLKKLN